MKRKHVIGLIVFLTVYILAAIGRETETRTSFSSAPTGSKAIFEALRRLELPVVWWRKSLSELKSGLPASSTLLLIAPSKEVERTKDLLDWVAEGNRLVVFGEGGLGITQSNLQRFWMAMKLQPDTPKFMKMVGSGGIQESKRPASSRRSLWEDLIEKLWNSVEDERVVRKEVTINPAEKGMEIRRALQKVSQLLLGKSSFSELSSSDQNEQDHSKKPVLPTSSPPNSALRSIVGTGESFQVAQRSWGSGEIWIFADSAFIENEHIDKADNLRLLYQILAGSQRVAFDEFHHGYVEPAPAQLKGKRDALIVFTGMLGLALLLIVISRSVRFGPPASIAHENIASSTEFATALGLLCKEYEARDLLASYRLLWMRRLSTVCGIPLIAGEKAIFDRAVEKKVLGSEQRIAAEEIVARFESGILFQQGREADIVDAISKLERIIESGENDKRSLIGGMKDGSTRRQAA